jgi:hypothetical protein
LECAAALHVVDGPAFFRHASHCLGGKHGLRLPTGNAKFSHEPSSLDDLVKGSWMLRYFQHLAKLKSKDELLVKSAGNFAFYVERQTQDKKRNSIRFYEVVDVQDDGTVPVFIVNKDEL